MLNSVVFVFVELFKMEQKARVLISRVTQIKIHEFLRMHATAETAKDRYIQTAIIFIPPNCKFGYYKFAKLFMF